MDDPVGLSGDEPPPGPPLQGLSRSILAVCAVFTVVGVLLAAFGEPINGKKPPPEQHTSGGRPTAIATGPPNTSHAPSATPRVTAAPRPSPTRTGPSAPPATQAPTPPPARREPPRPSGHVIVFNQTVHRHLAARFAAQLQAEGWTIDGVDTWRGNVPATTVYYPRGMEALARRLMADHDEVGRIRPAFAGASRTALTVILAKDFPVGNLAAGISSDQRTALAPVLGPAGEHW